MAAASLKGGVLKLRVHRVLLVHDGRHRFESDAEINRLAIRDAAMNAAGAVGGGAHLAAFDAERIVVLRAGQKNPAKTGANVETF